MEGKNIMHIQLRSHEMMHNRYEIVYELSFNQKYYEDIQALVNTLYDLENIDKISLLSPQLDLPM
jgi:hypothetical protein